MHPAPDLRPLEAMGRLAPGIAHELNTPVQFVMDSLEFLAEVTATQKKLLELYRGALPATPELKKAEEEADLDFLNENLASSIDRARDGLQRIAVIARSMRDFAHAGEKEPAPVDLNHGIESTLAIARGEYKLVADVEKQLEPGLKVQGLSGELNQVVLALVLNAARAIADRYGRSGGRGRITVGTRSDGKDVVLCVADTGGGIPEAIRDRLFERGTGHSLAIAHELVSKHGGTLTFETRTGEGTTFAIRLPALREEELAAA